MYPQVSDLAGIAGLPTDSSRIGQTLGDTSSLNFSMGEPLSHGPLSGLGGYLLLVAALLAMVCLFGGGSGSRAFPAYLKKFLQPGSGRPADDGHSAYETLFTLLSYVCLIVLGYLYFCHGGFFLHQTIDWQALGLSAALTSAYLGLRYTLFGVFSFVQLPRTAHRGLADVYSQVVNLSSLGFFVLIVLNEFCHMPVTLFTPVAVGLWAVVRLWSLVPLVKFFSRQRLPAIHIILYFCALEILPICLLVKLVVQWSPVL